ncbi:hypothetical protein AFEL58S_01993 [Afipia felis]
MSLATERETRSRSGELYVLGVAASVTIYQGALVCANASGYATPGATAANLTALGRAESTVAGGSVAGTNKVQIKRGCFHFKNSADDPVTAAMVGKDCYIVDDETVAKTSDTNARSKAGIVHEVDAAGVWVRF